MESGLESKAILVETEDRSKFSVKTLSVKAPGVGQVRVHMKYATFSVHDSLQHSYSSHAEYPYLAGYDGVGTIEEVGEGVEEFDKGDHVAVFAVPGNWTLTGKSNISNDHAKIFAKGKLWSISPHLDAYSEDRSIHGFRGLGTWSQYAVFPASNLIKLDHEPTLEDSGLGSVLATGLLGPSKIVDVSNRDNVVIFGSNSLALALFTSIKTKTEGTIVVVGAKDDQELFEGLGAKYVVDEGTPTDVQAKLMAIIPDGYDYSFEASSFNRFGTVALEICHKGWGRCALLTLGDNKGDTIKTKPFQLVTGRHWIGSYMGNVNIGKDSKTLLDAHESLTKNISNYIFPEDHVVSVDDFPEKWVELSKTATYHRTIIKF